MKKTFFLPMIILFFIIYYFLFPVEGSREITHRPRAEDSLQNMKSVPDSLAASLLINQGQDRYILPSDGFPPYSVEHRMSAFSDSHVLYRTGEGLFIKNIFLGKTMQLPFEGSPIALSGAFYSVDYGASKISSFAPEGTVLWTWHGLAPITAISQAQGYTVLGSLDGRLRFFDEKGYLYAMEPLPLEDDHVIYAAVLSPDAQRLAVVSGLENQYLRVYSVDPADFSKGAVLLSRDLLESQYRRPVKMFYAENRHYLWLEQEGKVLQIDPDSQMIDFPYSGKLLSLKYDLDEGLVYVLSLSSDKSSSLLKVYSLDGALLLDDKFHSYPSFFQLKEGALFFSLDRMLLNIKREYL